MQYPADMLRRVVSLIALLALTAQAVAQAGVDFDDGAPAQHQCDTQEHAQADCSCCPDSVPINGCAGLCSMMSALVPAPVAVAPAAGEQARRSNEACIRGPTYLPLNPPPIA
jgi:hypothetical protein